MKISPIFTAGNEFEEDLEILEEAALQVHAAFFFFLLQHTSTHNCIETF